MLPAPLRPEDAELVTEAKLARLLEVARESYDVIVVDTSPFFHGPMLATLDRTDELLLVCGLDVPTLKNVRLALQTLELLSFPPNADPLRPQPRELEGRAEAARGRGGARASRCSFEMPSDRAVPLVGQPRQPGRARRARLATSRKAIARARPSALVAAAEASGGRSAAAGAGEGASAMGLHDRLTTARASRRPERRPSLAAAGTAPARDAGARATRTPS